MSRLTPFVLGAVLASGGLAAPAAATPPPYQPCPIAKVSPTPPAPKPSPVPTHDPNLPAIGGDGLATTGLTVPPEAPPPPSTLSAKAWLVADLDTGAVLGACAPHAYAAPASLQKLLLAQTVLPKLDPATVVTVTAADLAFEPGSSAVGLLQGGRYPVATLWLGLLLNSGNDAANVLARLGGGPAGVPGTIAAMNAEARRLGAFDTHAETPSGLDGPGQVTSVYDLALISRALFDRPDFRRYAATLTTKIPAQPPKDPRGFQIQNDNKLLFNYPGALGGKTGFTDIARHTFVGAAQRDGRRLVVTMLNAEHKPVRTWQQAAALLDWGFSVPSDASVGRLITPEEAATAPTPGSSPSPNAAAAMGAGATTGTSSPKRMVLIGVGSIGSLFVLVWLGVLVAARRRRAANRRAAQAASSPGS
ncbi:MAG TPA: D-alanyl-D-alanine carboxypeptidase family protein [Micromonosporaceae bacterium]